MYKDELQHVVDKLNVFNNTSMKTITQLNKEEAQISDLLAKLNKIKDAHQKYIAEHPHEDRPKVVFDTTIQIMNPEEPAHPTGLKSVKDHKPTPMVRGLVYEEESE